MVELSYLLVAAVIILQLYICACTYWLLRKIDRYESIALGVVERYLSRRVYGAGGGVGAVSTYDKLSGVSTVSAVDAVGGVITVGTVSAVSTHDESRREVTNYIQKVLYYAPERVHNAAKNMMETWYCNLCIDLLTLCVSKNLIKDRSISDMKTLGTREDRK